MLVILLEVDSLMLVSTPSSFVCCMLTLERILGDVEDEEDMFEEEDVELEDEEDDPEEELVELEDEEDDPEEELVEPDDVEDEELDSVKPQSLCPKTAPGEMWVGWGRKFARGEFSAFISFSQQFLFSFHWK